VLAARGDPAGRRFWEVCFGRRGREELYDLSADPDCLVNRIAEDGRAAALKARLFKELAEQGDPRALGQGDVFDAYPHAHDRMRGFYEQWQRGTAPRADWVNPSDFKEPSKLDSR